MHFVGLHMNDKFTLKHGMEHINANSCVCCVIEGFHRGCHFV